MLVLNNAHEYVKPSCREILLKSECTSSLLAALKPTSQQRHFVKMWKLHSQVITFHINDIIFWCINRYLNKDKYMYIIFFSPFESFKQKGMKTFFFSTWFLSNYFLWWTFNQFFSEKLRLTIWTVESFDSVLNESLQFCKTFMVLKL
jgi:hypothetical protein